LVVGCWCVRSLELSVLTYTKYATTNITIERKTIVTFSKHIIPG
jgi:hypothetical protein